MSTLNNRLQLTLLKRKRSGNALQKGFTLVELMIVIVIVGILSAVALPNFLGTRNKAEAQSLIGSMTGFAKVCGANMISEDPADIADVPATITLSDGQTTAASGTEVPCDGSADIDIYNSTNFPNPTNIGGVRCGTAQANGTDQNRCTLTVASTSGSVTGSWSAQ